MRIRATPILNVIFLLVLVAGCAATNYMTATPGAMSLVDTIVSVGDGWLRVPQRETPEALSSSRTLSRENVSRDRLMLIPGIRDGQSLFRDNETSLPMFELGMDPQQIANLVSQSMQQSLWSGGATVSATNVREYGFLGTYGFLFDLDVDMPSGPNHKGFAGGFVYEERLYVNIFAAEAPAHFDEHQDAARHTIETVTIRIKTIRMN